MAEDITSTKIIRVFFFIVDFIYNQITTYMIGELSSSPNLKY